MSEWEQKQYVREANKRVKHNDKTKQQQREDLEDRRYN